MDRDLISVANHSYGAVARAGRSRERETGGSANGARFGLCRRRPFAEPWPERAVAESWKTTPLLSRRPVTYRCAL